MKQFIIGISGITNGGKTTLANRLLKVLPNCTLICQDDYFKPDSYIETDENGFKQFDVIEALDMETMMAAVHSWIKQSQDTLTVDENKEMHHACEKKAYFLIVEGFLLYHYKSYCCRPLENVLNRKYFLIIPYEESKKRRSQRIYNPPDPPGYFDGHVWPMYLKHKKEMEEANNEIVYLDGTKSEEEIQSSVYADIINSFSVHKESY
ncbi:nicotinamide riboside kinase 1 L homeolog isoform X1 [Xenopus laevis]|uniref:Nicotinamide riboside kinase 1 L homeolog isoform X1 n=1 Tax=Xenopus laevis TaxID=8355 RepID=A0A8J0U930_XENLA|nr:nicotinamide riboside kinase 1 L homeolog isoform X1 [Xenopus laevis]XP_018099633.1 nicotinamide riboside kinase 1 L homeolog isoform X1 [Xenopus laevis]